MVILVYGGSGSGKSEFAEELCVRLKSKRLYYIATMKYNPDDSELAARIGRHRRLRRGKGFRTIEEPFDLEAVAEKIAKDCKTLGSEPSALEWKGEKAGGSVTVLLECLSNLCANRMFLPGGAKAADEVADEILCGIKKLSATCKSLVLVSNNVFDDGISYDGATKNYLDALSKINEQIAASCDKVYEVVCGIPLELK